MTSKINTPSNETQVQKISRSALVSQGCKIPSVELMKCFLKNDRIELSVKRKALMTGSKPNFDVIFQPENSTGLITLKNGIGLKNILKLLIVILEDLVNYFNVQRPMNMNQIEDLAIEILEEMRDLRFEEIVAFIEGIKREEYGKIYERFDAPTFWKFYWGENPDDPNSYNFKKMKFCLADAQKDNHIEFKNEPTELEALLTKPRRSNEAIQQFIEKVKRLPDSPPESK